jgi:hypothetical protein
MQSKLFSIQETCFFRRSDKIEAELNSSNRCPTKRAPRLRFATRGELPDPRTNAEDRRWGLPPSAAYAHPRQFSTPYHFSGWTASPSPPQRRYPVKSARDEPQTVSRLIIQNVLSIDSQQQTEFWV